MARSTAKSDLLLADYKRKRDLTRTKEPDDRASFASSGHRFVVQKHAASRLHYDFRLELNGVLKAGRHPGTEP